MSDLASGLRCPAITTLSFLIGLVPIAGRGQLVAGNPSVTRHGSSSAGDVCTAPCDLAAANSEIPAFGKSAIECRRSSYVSPPALKLLFRYFQLFCHIHLQDLLKTLEL